MTALNDTGTVAQILISKSSAWREWMHFAVEHHRLGPFLRGAEVASAVRHFLSVSDSAPPNVFVERMVNVFKIVPNTSERQSSAMLGEGWVAVTKDIGALFSHGDVTINVRSENIGRKLSLIAHEYGHLFYAILSEPKRFDDAGFKKRNALVEVFCWDFALEVLCPRFVRESWSWRCLMEMLPSDAPPEIQSLDRVITYWHLRAIAQKHRISLRLAIRALDRHRLLETQRSVIAVFRHTPNRYSGLQVGLRLKLQARPSFCYLIPNQRAYNQGFKAIDDVFRLESANKLAIADEEIKLRICCKGKSPAWHLTEHKTRCAYTAIDVKEEGRYILVSFAL